MLKPLVKRTLNSLGLDLRRYNPRNYGESRLAHFLASRGIDVVFDIGANTGHFAHSLRDFGYRGQIVSFEPLTSAWNALKKSSASDPGWEVAPRMAIGNADAEIEIHIAANSVSSSILGMLEAHESAAPGSGYVGVESAPLRRLDSIAAEYAGPNARLFLKADTQGFEGQVIEGAPELLKRTNGLQLEVSFVPLYEGQVLFSGIVSSLQSVGFDIWDVAPMFFDPKSLRMLQGDAVFFRN